MKASIIIHIQSGPLERHDCYVEADIEATQATALEGEQYLVEVDAAGTLIDETVPFQLDRLGDGSTGLTFQLKGTTPPETERHYALLAGERRLEAPQVRIEDDVPHQGQASYRIETPAATYLYHKQGAGFASLYDPEGNDWLSYRPYGGSDGRYRGIPNLAHPENHFHPGGENCQSTLASAGPLKVHIASQSVDGKWACTWDILPDHACLTVLKVDHPYWFLYEGTPGGRLDEKEDYCLRSDGVRLPLGASWEMPLPAPEWVCFGTANTRRALLLVNHEGDTHIDSYWPMEHNMTVFGFGRNGLKKHMTLTPARFTVRFVDCDTESITDESRQAVEAALNPVTIRIEPGG